MTAPRDAHAGAPCGTDPAATDATRALEVVDVWGTAWRVSHAEHGWLHLASVKCPGALVLPEFYSFNNFGPTALRQIADFRDRATPSPAAPAREPQEGAPLPSDLREAVARLRGFVLVDNGDANGRAVVGSTIRSPNSAACARVAAWLDVLAATPAAASGAGTGVTNGAVTAFSSLFDMLSRRDPSLNATLYEDPEFARRVAVVYAALAEVAR